jgi:hypothetical protein
MYRFGRVLTIGVILASLYLAGPVGMAPRAVAALATPVRLGVGVTVDGIVQLAPSDLATAGVDLATVDPSTFAMSSQGQPVAIRVTGEGDGKFDPQDRVIFFGQKFRGTQMEEKYTDERVYWLEIGGAAGPRIPDVDAIPQGDLTPPQDVAASVHAEQNTTWWALHCIACLDTQDTWFWADMHALAGQPVAAALPYVVPDPAPGYPAEFRLEEISRNPGLTATSGTTVAVNGLSVMNEEWVDKVRKVFTAPLPAGLLVSGVNQVDLGTRTVSGNGGWVYANYWEVDYRRLFRAWQDQFDFRAEGVGQHEYVVDNWTSSQVGVWDISDPNQPRRLIASSGATQATVQQVRFRTDDVVDARYWLQTEATYAHPASSRLRSSTVLKDKLIGADAIIVTPKEFLSAAEELATWHRAHGRRTLVVNLQDVYDEFNDGILNPKAIQDMLIWGAGNWTAPAPVYLTLMGDGHFNFKGYNPDVYGTDPNPLPPLLAWIDPWQGEVAADPLYGDLNGDGVPEVAVGRLAVNTPAEANTVVAKIVTYDETTRSQPWQRQTLFVADNPDSAGDFHSLSDEIINNYLPLDLAGTPPTRAYLPGSANVPPTTQQIADTRKVILDWLQAGVWLVQYSGHGAINLWASEMLLKTVDVPGLTNGARLPVVMVFNCLDGYFIHPATQSLAETLQRRQGGGAVAAISPSGLGITSDQQNFRRILMTVLFKDGGVRDLGTALTVTKRQFYDTYGPNYLIGTMTLFGDPAMRLPQAGTVLDRVHLPLILR